MLDIQFIREHADIVKESQRKRGESVELVDEVLRSDETRRSALKVGQGKPANIVVDPTWLEGEELREPEGDAWHPADQLTRYLSALFDPEDIVGYVTAAFERDGRWTPAGKGDCTRTAGEIIQQLAKYGDDLSYTLGQPNAEAGAWIRFNPLDGQGVRNDNVAEFRYALVESDEMAPGRQMAVMRALELPIAAVVHSGNKSVHAIVRVDAKDYDEYRKRVDFLYRTCADNGLKLDTQNKNPSRLSRMPGVERAGRKQWLVAESMGRASWKDWREWLDEQNDDSFYLQLSPVNTYQLLAFFLRFPSQYVPL